MIGSIHLKPYPAYKESGMPWVGSIPNHWKLQRLDRLFTLRSELPVGGDQRVTGYIDGRVTLRSNVAGQKIKGVLQEAGWQRVYPGDFAISGMNAHLGGMGISDSLGKCSPIYLVLKPKNGTNAPFIALFIRYMANCGSLKALVNTIRFNSADFKREDIKKIFTLLPPSEEQAAIVRYLDYMDRRIRRYINAKKKLISLLNEQKQAIIQQAVTRGLDPNVRLKPSGVEWLGMIPEHWKVYRLKVILSKPMRNGLFKRKDAYGSGVPLINVGDVYQDNFCINPESLEQVNATSEEIVRFGVLPGDLFFVRSSLKLEGTGRSAFLKECNPSTIFECHLVQGRPNPARVNQRFLAIQLNSFCLRQYLISRANAVTMATIAQDILQTCPVWLMSLHEQAKILDFIDHETMKINMAVSKAAGEITFLNEYRIRLIADVVTGKLDVREAAAALPVESEEAPGEDNNEQIIDDDSGEEEEAIPEGEKNEL